MSKIILNDVGTLDSFTTAAATINANSAVIETAMDNTLSRDGTSPNQMAANIDMNSHRVLNLPAPASSTEPLRQADLTTGTIQYTGGTNIGIAGTTISTTNNPTFSTSVTTPNLVLAGTSVTSKTGTGVLVLATTPTLVTPVLGVATATSINGATVSPGHYSGEPSNGSAAAGEVGELMTSTVLSAAAVSLTTGVAANITSVSLTAGDWDVWGSIWLLPAGTTTSNVQTGWISTSSASGVANPATNVSHTQLWQSLPAGGGSNFLTGPCVIQVSSTTPVFLETAITFAVSTMKAYGTIWARRRR